MTHDELLADIDTKILLSEHTIYPIYMQAFRAVVELHKPTDLGMAGLSEHLWCSVCHKEMGSYDCANEDYPCPTIQAIEKELA